jgi:tetratricopeptide (TPR) repeat protein
MLRRSSRALRWLWMAAVSLEHDRKTMELERTCPQCRRLIPMGSTECPHCAHHVLLESESILFLSLLALAVLFVLTGFVARSYHSGNTARGEEWYERGEADLKASHADAAIVDFRTALLYDRDNSLDQLSLAKALSAANRTEEARAYLTSLWERNPENAVVNLELGRLAVRADNTNDALRYYHNAMYANWGTENPGDERRNARLELFGYLLQHGEREQAQAELVDMAALLPPDASLHSKVGQLFMRVGDYARAVTEYDEALKLDPKADAATFAGAGEAEFRVGNYAEARRYLERALRDGAANPGLKRMEDQAGMVLAADPFLQGLSQSERISRAVADFEQAVRRLAACGMLVGAPSATSGAGAGQQALSSSDPALDALADRARTLQPQVSIEALRKNPDLVDQIMSLVFHTEQAAAPQECGAPEPMDHALSLLAARHKSP